MECQDSKMITHYNIINYCYYDIDRKFDLRDKYHSLDVGAVIIEQVIVRGFFHDDRQRN